MAFSDSPRLVDYAGPQDGWQSPVDCTSLENWRTFTRTVGSNPTPSAFVLATHWMGRTRLVVSDTALKSFHVYLYGPDCGPIESSFESAALRLQSLAGLYFEPDGSFVWSKPGGAEQVFGMLYDAAGKLQYVELWGNCQRAMWQEIVQMVLGNAKHDLAVMMLPERQLQDLQGFEETAFC